MNRGRISNDQVKKTFETELKKKKKINEFYNSITLE